MAAACVLSSCVDEEEVMFLFHTVNHLTLSNPIFLPTAYSQALIVLGGKEVGGLLVIILQF
jgi:hypothetical protein